MHIAKADRGLVHQAWGSLFPTPKEKAARLQLVVLSKTRLAPVCTWVQLFFVGSVLLLCMFSQSTPGLAIPVRRGLSVSGSFVPGYRNECRSPVI